jgi:hypothetical protein
MKLTVLNASLLVEDGATQWMTNFITIEWETYTCEMLRATQTTA